MSFFGNSKKGLAKTAKRHVETHTARTAEAFGPPGQRALLLSGNSETFPLPTRQAAAVGPFTGTLAVDVCTHRRELRHGAQDQHFVAVRVARDGVNSTLHALRSLRKVCVCPRVDGG